MENGPTTPPRWKPFREWWEEPVTKDAHGELFSRKDYVLTMSNKEGGAHVDHSLDSKYADLTRFNSLGWTMHMEGDEEGKPVEHNPALPSVRQIAYEVEKTIRQHPLKLGLS